MSFNVENTIIANSIEPSSVQGEAITLILSDAFTGPTGPTGPVGSIVNPVEAVVTVDVTDPEAFLVRQNGDTGDVFTVNTTDSIVTLQASLTNTYQPYTIRQANATQSVANATQYTVLFGTETASGSGPNNPTYASGLFTIQETGVYIVTYLVNIGPGAGGDFRDFYLQVNALFNVNLTREQAPFSATKGIWLSASTIVNLSVGNTVRLIAFQNSGVSLDIKDDTNFEPNFGLAKLY
jgi:hypothetical protein